MSYIVYKNRVHNYASVHETSCGYVKQHGGVSSTTPPPAGITKGFAQRNMPTRRPRAPGGQLSSALYADAGFPRLPHCRNGDCDGIGCAL